jgi:hypothetical protein
MRTDLETGVEAAENCIKTASMRVFPQCLDVSGCSTAMTTEIGRSTIFSFIGPSDRCGMPSMVGERARVRCALCVVCVWCLVCCMCVLYVCVVLCVGGVVCVVK